MVNKPCRDCGIARGMVLFRPGRNICRACDSKQAVAYAKKYPERKRVSNRRYLKTVAGRAAMQRKGRRRASRYPEKRRANFTVQTAIRNGTLVQQPCEQCEDSPTHAHHDDYFKPLQVRWLCAPCHRQEHRAMLAQLHKDSPK